MLREFLTKCLEMAKADYFATDHHHYGSEEAKDVEWKRLLKQMDRDFFIEWIDPVIYDLDIYLWQVSDGFKMYMEVKEMVEEM